MESLLSQLPNGGAVVAVIVITVIFVKKLEKTESMVESLITTFAHETTNSRAEYREHVSKIMEQGLAAHAETREAIRALTSTIGGLKTAHEREDSR